MDFSVGPDNFFDREERRVRSDPGYRPHSHTGFDFDGGGATATAERQSEPIKPTNTADRSANEFRPTTFEGIVGQEKVKRTLCRMTEAALRRGQPLDHLLLVGPSGYGKTTFAHVIANQLGADVYQVEAPISHDTLVELSRTMNDGDILFIDEIHQQAIQERRGKSSATQPEVLFGVMEDFTLTTGTGVLPFPRITVMGATTDEGMLPDPFIMRFPIRPALERYSADDMEKILVANCRSKKLKIARTALDLLKGACRGTPRVANNYIRNCASMTDEFIDYELADVVLSELNGVTPDGLTQDMQKMLTFLLTRAERYNASTGEIKYQASVSTIATALGKARDQKAVVLRVEPYLIERGYVQVGHGGRTLTDQGVMRARRLLKEAV